MKKLWLNAGIVGSLSAAFGSILWSQKTNESNSSRTCSPLDSEPTSPYELQLVQVLFRHGARTPLKSIPNVLEWVPTLLEPPPHTHINFVVTDLNGGPRPSAPMEENYRKNLLTGGSFAGQLTTLGMQQLYELGKRLRQRYIEDSPFLSPAFSPSEVYVRSTNIWRTIESAKCLVAGLFQQKQKEILPILTTEAEAEILYPNFHGCKLLKILGGYTHGLPCPPALDTWRNKVEQRAIDMMCYIYNPSKRESLQLCVGPLLHILLLNFEDKLQGALPEPNRKLFLYSVHDTTLIPCLMAMGIFDMRWPPYAADITLELYKHRQTKEAYVKVSYIGQDQLLPGCNGVYCPLQEFKKILSVHSLSSEHYQSLCNSTEPLPK
uniref:Uncharacterized protein n=1 Tax=Periophthalmus magnuspinnatus TaxID=409849 RepID=A0A3B4A4Z7_9GOBI